MCHRAYSSFLGEAAGASGKDLGPVGSPWGPALPSSMYFTVVVQIVELAYGKVSLLDPHLFSFPYSF